jgi:hypothetical protein
MEPQLCVIEQVARSQCNVLQFQRVADVKVPFTLVEPCQRIAGAVVFRKLKLMSGGHDVITRVVHVAS